MIGWHIIDETSEISKIKMNSYSHSTIDTNCICLFSMIHLFSNSIFIFFHFLILSFTSFSFTKCSLNDFNELVNVLFFKISLCVTSIVCYKIINNNGCDRMRSVHHLDYRPKSSSLNQFSLVTAFLFYENENKLLERSAI